jgi:hypothetical protein
MIVLLAGGVLGLYLSGVQLYPRLAASYWKAQLADAPDDDVKLVIDQIAALEDDGDAMLVEALASNREIVAQAAKNRLIDRLEQWKSQKGEKEESASHLLALAEALADRVVDFGPAARGDAANLAMLILVCSDDRRGSADRIRLIAACDDVFHAAGADQGDLSYISPVREKFAESSEGNLPNALADARWDAERNTATHFDSLPGGGLPIEAEPAEERMPSELPSGESGEMPPSYFQAPKNSRQLDFSNRAASPMEVPNSSGQRIQKIPPSAEKRVKQTSLEQLHREAQYAKAPRELETLELLRQLGKVDEERDAILTAELIRRGLSAAELELGRRMFDPDPRVRLKFVAELPGTPEIDVSEWLFQSCKDEDAEVRLASFSLLATTRNPILLQKVKALAQSDSDPRIQRQADKMIESGSK